MVKGCVCSPFTVLWEGLSPYIYILKGREASHMEGWLVKDMRKNSPSVKKFHLGKWRVCLTIAAESFEAYKWGPADLRRYEALGGRLPPDPKHGSFIPEGNVQPQAFTRPPATIRHPLPTQALFLTHSSGSFGEAEPSWRGGTSGSTFRSLALPISPIPRVFQVSTFDYLFFFVKWPYFAYRKRALVSKVVCLMPRLNAPEHLAQGQNCLSLHTQRVRSTGELLTGHRSPWVPPNQKKRGALAKISVFYPNYSASQW